MLASISLAVFALSALLSASPAPQKRNAGILPVSHRTLNSGSANSKLFDVEGARRERIRIRSKYRGNKTSSLTPHVKRSIKNIEPFDIQTVRKRKTRRCDCEDDGYGDDGTGLDPLTDSDPTDELYYGQIYLGTPPQMTTADFDTGSSDLVVPRGDCNNCTGPLFFTNHSSTYVGTNVTFKIEYADKSGAKGFLANDTVTVAGLTVENQVFGSCFNETNGFSGPNAALLGLGFTANAESGAPPFFVNLASQGALASNLFSFYMARHGGNGSELCFGCVDSSKYNGSFSYFPLDFSITNDTALYWSLTSTGLMYNDTASSNKTIPVIIDSGTTLIYVSNSEAKALYDGIPGAAKAPDSVGEGFYTIPCSTIETLPPIAFGFGNQMFEINPLDFNLGPVNETDPMCVAAIAGESDDLGILGDTFMKNWVTAFDLGGSRMGFARAI